MARSTIFVKGNSDVADALFACRDAGGQWGGLNEALRERGSSTRVRVRHETMLRSDALLEATGEIPEGLDHVAFDWPYTAACQFGAGFFDGTADAHVLSILPDVAMKLLRHRASGRLFYPGPAETLSPEMRARLRAECELAPLLEPERSMEHFAGIVARLRERSRAPLLVFNMSTVVPGDRVVSHRGVTDSLSLRIKRFNLALIELARLEGVFIVDVDRVVAAAGADRLKLDGGRVNVAGSRLVAEEALRVLEIAGVLDRSEATPAARTEPTIERARP